uniref:Uncharacterized protein n=1 Tax=Rhabditophanes sp. KR3021 TaxID=114890 RepID=A0AC35THL9_9BILA
MLRCHYHKIAVLILSLLLVGFVTATSAKPLKSELEDDGFDREDRSDFRPLQFGKRSDANYRPLQFGKRSSPYLDYQQPSHKFLFREY